MISAGWVIFSGAKKAFLLMGEKWLKKSKNSVGHYWAHAWVGWVVWHIKFDDLLIKQKDLNSQTSFISVGGGMKGTWQNECIIPKAVGMHNIQAQDTRPEAGLGSISQKLWEKKWHKKKIILKDNR